MGEDGGPKYVHAVVSLLTNVWADYCCVSNNSSSSSEEDSPTSSSSASSSLEGSNSNNAMVTCNGGGGAGNDDDEDEGNGPLSMRMMMLVNAIGVLRWLTLVAQDCAPGR